MMRKILLTLLLLALLSPVYIIHGADSGAEYTVLNDVDKNTFNEYKYKITEQYIKLRNSFDINKKIDATIANNILTLANDGFKYLPNDLKNINLLSDLDAAIKSGLNYPNNSQFYDKITTQLEIYLTQVSIKSITGSAEAYPSSGNAPLTVTLRANATDPSGTQLENYNYTWRTNISGKKTIIGNKVSLNYVFREEGNYKIFLDVTSNHKNNNGYTDVLPLSTYVNIEVKEKVASIVLKVNSINLLSQDSLKFLPEEAKYGLLFDATSSTPTSGAKFVRTEWDFGNGVKRSYDGAPQIERVVYANEGDYKVKLTLRTNEGKSVDREFSLYIHQPIATIQVSAEEGYVGDKFTFTANPGMNQSNLTYSWRIVDINNDMEVVGKNSSTFTYTFKDKGKYNVLLYVTEASGEMDVDTKIIYINSRVPEAKFTYSVPNSNKPNTILLDGTNSFDLDYTDDGKLVFNWEIDGQRVNLTNPNYNGSNGYYTFSSIGDHSVTLEVIDPDNMSGYNTQKVNIKSILSVDFNPFPRVSQIDKSIRFIADSPKAQYFEWDFGDGTKIGETKESTTHVFKKSGIYKVRLRVVDASDNENTAEKNVFIGDSEYPYAFITLKDSKQNEMAYESGECGGEGAYIVNRTETYTFSGDESVDITGEKTGLSYSWKMLSNRYSTQSFQKKFDELGCFKISLMVQSDKNGRTSSQEINVRVKNLDPIIGNLDVKVKDIEADPVVVTVSALGAKDLDGVIQSYLWYYYTDVDTDPQDFRATKTNSTTFVLPKITGNYYFAVTVKDNNEARVSSEGGTGGEKYFVTLTGDNINVPIVDLKVNKNSISLGDEVIFTASVENVLGQSLNNLATFSWDFDGDGFYDTETTKNSISHRYEKSGEQFAKVKVKYKGFSNTKTVTMNVANVLKADFDYVSIGSTFIFFDNSLSNGANYEWNMGDGNIVKDKKSFVYKYIDNEAAHNVTLKLTESTKTKDITKKVTKDLRNFMSSNKETIAVYSNFPIEDDELELEDKLKNLYFSITTTNKDVINYIADFNINYDSDLNGGSDDDADNKFQDSYTGGDNGASESKDKFYIGGVPISIELNDSREQIVRLYITDESSVIASKDIKIIKKYIEEVEDTNIDITTIYLPGVSEAVKLKFEKIKDAVSKFPQESRLQGMTYIQKLQEERGDKRERTNTILEFEGFIQGENISGGVELIDLLESLLVEGEERGELEIAFEAAKNLIPTNISCVEGSLEELTEITTCYNLLINKLTTIYENQNIDENRVLGSEVLKNIELEQNNMMTNKQKEDFKGVLKILVYRSVANIPDDEKKVVIDSYTPEPNSSIMNTIFGAFKVLAIIFGLIAGVILLFFIYYKISGKKESSFTDFIAEKTSSSSKKGPEEWTENLDDILGNDVLEPKLENTENKVENVEVESKVEDKVESEIPKDVFSDFPTEEKPIEPEVTGPEIVESEQTTTQQEKAGVPDWLRGSFSDDLIENFEEKEGNGEGLPDDTSQTISDDSVSLDEKVSTPISGPLSTSQGERENEEESESGSGGSVEEGLVPDEDVLSNEGVVTDNSFSNDEPKLETKEELDEFTKLEPEEIKDSYDDVDIPDWLKGSFSVDNKTTEATETSEAPKEEVSIEEKQEDLNPITILSDEKVEGEEVIEEKEEESIVPEAISDVEPKVEEEKVEAVVEEKTSVKEKKPKTTKKSSSKQKKVKGEKPATDNNYSLVPEDNEEDTKVEEEVSTSIPGPLSPSQGEKGDEEKSKSGSGENAEEGEEQNQKSNSNSPDTELWDDGMKIPDWLKTDDDK